jgi:Ran GTPase-activating protein 1
VNQLANLADIFTGRLLSEIPDALSHLLTSILNHPRLNTIDLSDNAFGFNTKGPLIAFLRSHVPLQHLYLNNNGLGPDAGIDVANALSELHARKEEARKEGKLDSIPDLETVICGRNRLENGSMMAWAKTYSLHNRIRVVKMVQNGVRQEGVHHLVSDGLKHATQLQVLDLQDNTFTAIGGRALASIVPGWTELRVFGGNDLLLGGKASLWLAEALGKGGNKKLEVLHLQYNDMTATGLQALATAAKEALPALKKIELNGNKFSEEDPSVIVLQELLEERKEKFGGDVVIEDEWGLDELDELDDEEEDEDEEEEEEPTHEEIAEKLLKDAREAKKEPVIQLKDKEVDDLADQLEKTEI